MKKTHKLTYIKGKRSDYTRYIPKKETYGQYAKEPEAGTCFVFLDADDLGDGTVTSTVLNVKPDLEPGATYIETLNSIYRLEEYNGDH